MHALSAKRKQCWLSSASLRHGIQSPGCFAASNLELGSVGAAFVPWPACMHYQLESATHCQPTYSVVLMGLKFCAIGPGLMSVGGYLAIACTQDITFGMHSWHMPA